MYSFLSPSQIFYGNGALEKSAKTVASLGKKALLVTDPVMIKLGNAKKVMDILGQSGVDCSVFDGVTGEPTDKMVLEGLKCYRENNCDFLVAVGGGSPIDAMKAIAAVNSCGGSINDFLGKVIEAPTAPMVAVPTTSGTGSEATQFTIITNTEKNIKMLIKGAVLMPTVAVADPLFSVSAPKGVTAATGLDALCHAAEAYTSKKAQPLTDEFAVSAVKKIFKYLPRCYENGNDLEAREQMSLAALEAGMAFNNSSVTVIHGMSRPIGALFHIPHGISNAMLLSKCFEYVVDGAYGRFAKLAFAIGAADENDNEPEAALKFIEACKSLCEICQIPTLEAYGINKEEFFSAMNKMADDALFSGSPANTAKALCKEDILSIYKSLW